MYKGFWGLANVYISLGYQTKIGLITYFFCSNSGCGVVHNIVEYMHKSSQQVYIILYDVK